MVLPGPEAQQLATYIGWLMHRTWGGIVAGGLFVLPSLFILIALSWIYIAYGDVPAGRGHPLRHQARGHGDRAVRRVSHRLARAAERRAVGDRRGGLRRHLRAARAVSAHRDRRRRSSAAIGGRVAPGQVQDRRRTRRGEQRASAPRSSTTTRRPRGTRCFSWPSLAMFVRRRARDVGRRDRRADAALRLGIARSPRSAGSSPRPRCSRSAARTPCCPTSTRAASKTTSGSRATQMIDGLALGETTPGPLIMVVAFVGFVGAWVQGSLRPRDRCCSPGAAGATVATFFTFLPSLPLHPDRRSARRDRRTATSASPRRSPRSPPRSSASSSTSRCSSRITCCGRRVSADRSTGSRPSIGIAAFIALWRYKVGIMPVIGACASLGAVLVLAGLSF